MQVWDFEMHGRRVVMKSMFDMPRSVELAKQWSYIDTYGLLCSFDGPICFPVLSRKTLILSSCINVFYNINV